MQCATAPPRLADGKLFSSTRSRPRSHSHVIKASPSPGMHLSAELAAELRKAMLTNQGEATTLGGGDLSLPSWQKIVSNLTGDMTEAARSAAGQLADVQGSKDMLQAARSVTSQAADVVRLDEWLARIRSAADRLPDVKGASTQLDSAASGVYSVVKTLQETANDRLESAMAGAASRVETDRLLDSLPSLPQTLQPHWGASVAQQITHSWVDSATKASSHGIAAATQAAGAVASSIKLPSSLMEAVQQIEAAMHVVLEVLPGTIGLSQYPEAWQTLSRASVGGHSAGVLSLVAIAVTALIAVSVPPRARLDTSGQPTTYDAEALAAFYAVRPVAVAVRSMQIGWRAAHIAASLLVDYMQGALDRNSPERAAQVRGAIEQLGPAFIKVAQALSTRGDLLNPAYLAEISRLQDRVACFSDVEAWNSIGKAFGGDVGAGLVQLSPTPVAAASLGQVYRGILRPELGGHAVAVKVLRPGVLESVSLDLYLMRQTALALQRLPDIQTDWAAIIEEWASSFFMELNYETEADNARRFKKDVEMEKLTGIVVPEVYVATAEVLITEWIDGERLSESKAADVRELCNTLLNAFLVQLLDTGFLHADPHHGNLMRTGGGRVAILDYGLVTTIPPDTSLALVEYIAHLSIGDWPSVAEDLVKLGFIPEDAPDPRTSGLAEPLGRVLEQLVVGGGAAKVNVDGVLAELNSLGRDYPYFRVPPYFALILRCFTVIEGIALSVDPDYAIVRQCLPYLSQRLLTDDHPRARAALRSLLFGEGEHINVERVELLLRGLQNYTVAGLSQLPAGGKTAGDGAGAGVDAPVLSSTAKEAVSVLFSPTGSYVQELVVKEAAGATDAAFRVFASNIIANIIGSGPAVATASMTAALGPWRRVLLPLPTPLEALSQLGAMVQPDDADHEALKSARGIMQAVSRELGPPVLDGESVRANARLVEELLPLMPQVLPGLGAVARLFVDELAQRASQRAQKQ